METINEVIERVRSDLNYAVDITRDKDVKFPIHAGDATKLLDELETVRAERDALRAALQSVYDTASTPLDPDDDDETEMRNRLDQIETRAYEALWTDDSAALNTQPQAEWTPREGMAVQVKATGERGTIFMHVNRYYQWRVQFTNGELKDHSTDELEPAD